MPYMAYARTTGGVGWWRWVFLLTFDARTYQNWSLTSKKKKHGIINNTSNQDNLASKLQTSHGSTV